MRSLLERVCAASIFYCVKKFFIRASDGRKTAGLD
jgi:hypothetical protein